MAKKKNPPTKNGGRQFRFFLPEAYITPLQRLADSEGRSLRNFVIHRIKQTAKEQ